MSYAERFGGAALVTGASAGIGEAFARALAARGMDLMLVARRRDRLEALAAQVSEAHGVRAVPLELDLARHDAATVAARAAGDAGLRVGLLINNAGFGAYGPFDKQDPERDLRMVDLNCRAPVALTHAFLPGMRARGRGGLVFVASTAAYQPTPWLATYGATKAFDLMLAEALWAELRGTGIEVLALSPGYTRTEFQEVAGTGRVGAAGGGMSAEQVVDIALRALGKKPSVVTGIMNKTAAFGVRLIPRATAARTAARVIASSRRPVRDE